MNPEEAQRWTNEVLDEVFVALAASGPLTEMLVFRGARVLAKRLGRGRQSMDIDACLRRTALETAASLEELGAMLERLIGDSVRSHFLAQDVIRFNVTSVKVRKKPKKRHPAGLDGFRVTLNVQDRAKHAVRGLPGIKIDISAPEELGPDSVAEMSIGEYTILAYKEQRVVGEKLRAFLSCLPEFRRKSPREKTRPGIGERIRVKDVFDIAVAERVFPVDEQHAFWGSVIDEFVIACRSRGVDCAGMASFEQLLSDTREQYESDEGLQSLIPFDDAWTVIRRVVKRMESEHVVPFTFDLPPLIHEARE